MEEVKNSIEVAMPTKIKTKKPNYNSVEARSERAINALSRDGGKYISLAEGVDVLLVAAIKDGKDVQFVCLDRDRKVVCVSTKDVSYHIIRAIPASLTVLDWILYHDADVLMDTVSVAVEGKELLTPIYIKVNAPKPHNGKRNNFNKKKDNKKK